MFARFDHQKCAERAESKTATGLAAFPDRFERLLEAVAGKFIQHQLIRPLAILGAADQRDIALPGGDAGVGDPNGVDAGRFLAHESARRTGDAVPDRNLAGEKIGKLRQEKRRAQVAHQFLVEESGRIGRLRRAGENDRVDIEIALAAAGGDDHIHARKKLGIAFCSRGIERKTGGIGADALPGIHLALIALFRDLRVEIDRRNRMHDERWKKRRIA